MPLPTQRKSKDGTKILVHDVFVKPYLLQEESEVDAENPNGWSSPELYPHNSQKLNDLLASEEWTYPESETPTESPDFIQVAAIRNLMATTKAGIQSMSLTSSETLRLKDMYPNWAAGIDVKVGNRYNYDDNLWEVVQAHTTQEGWEPGATTLSLWKKVDDEGHIGSLDDPIPYEQGMALEKDKYYIQYGVVYICIQSSGAQVYDLYQIPSIVTPVD